MSQKRYFTSSEIAVRTGHRDAPKCPVHFYNLLLPPFWATSLLMLRQNVSPPHLSLDIQKAGAKHSTSPLKSFLNHASHNLFHSLIKKVVKESLSGMMKTKPQSCTFDTLGKGCVWRERFISVPGQIPAYKCFILFCSLVTSNCFKVIINPFHSTPVSSLIWQRTKCLALCTLRGQIC